VNVLAGVKKRVRPPSSEIFGLRPTSVFAENAMFATAFYEVGEFSSRVVEFQAYLL
jgi:hypothetical protein